jgi:hypothetical protein
VISDGGREIWVLEAPFYFSVPLRLCEIAFLSRCTRVPASTSGVSAEEEWLGL